MEAAEDLLKRNAQLASLIQERLGVRGRGLNAKMHRAGRLIPRWVRAELRQLVKAEQLMAHPKLMMQVDPAALAEAHSRCEAWLKSVNPYDRYKDWWLSFAAVNAFNLIVVVGLFLLAVRLMAPL